MPGQATANFPEASSKQAPPPQHHDPPPMAADDTQARNIEAAADHATAVRQEELEQAAKAKNKRVDDVNLAKLVAAENASKNKFPHYPGLERWELLEKMGDGAFSNVYRARDLESDAGEVAIKVVRKFEMNSMQVCKPAGERPMSLLFLSLLFLFFFIFTPPRPLFISPSRTF